MKKTFILVFVWIGLMQLLSAQPITGYWQGKLGGQSFLVATQVELKLVRDGDSLSGTAYYYTSPSNFTRFSVKGFQDAQTGQFFWWNHALIAQIGKPVGSRVQQQTFFFESDFSCPNPNEMYLSGEDRKNKKSLKLTKTNAPNFDDDWNPIIDSWTQGGNNTAWIAQVKTDQEDPDKMFVKRSRVTEDAPTAPVAKTATKTPGNLPVDQDTSGNTALARPTGSSSSSSRISTPSNQPNNSAPQLPTPTTIAQLPTNQDPRPSGMDSLALDSSSSIGFTPGQPTTTNSQGNRPVAKAIMPPKQQSADSIAPSAPVKTVSAPPTTPSKPENPFPSGSMESPNKAVDSSIPNPKQNTQPPTSSSNPSKVGLPLQQPTAPLDATPKPTQPLPIPLVPDQKIIEKKFENREREVQTIIPVSGDSITLQFYDNAEVDGDSISLFLNNKLLFAHIRLSTEPYVFKIAINDLIAQNDLVMVAENLGSIPPNTSYMIVFVGLERYTARLESTEGKSALIRLNKKE